MFKNSVEHLGSDDELDKALPAGAQLQFTAVVFR